MLQYLRYCLPVNASNHTGFSRLYFDGDCSFCESSVNFLLKQGCRFKPIKFSDDQQFMDILRASAFNFNYEGSVYISRSGKIFFGADAIRKAASEGNIWLRSIAKILSFLPFVLFSRDFYKWIANHRDQISQNNLSCGIVGIPESPILKSESYFRFSTKSIVLFVFLGIQFVVPGVLLVIRFLHIARLLYPFSWSMFS